MVGVTYCFDSQPPLPLIQTVLAWHPTVPVMPVLQFGPCRAETGPGTVREGELPDKPHCSAVHPCIKMVSDSESSWWTCYSAAAIPGKQQAHPLFDAVSHGQQCSFFGRNRFSCTAGIYYLLCWTTG